MSASLLIHERILLKAGVCALPLTKSPPGNAGTPRSCNIPEKEATHVGNNC